MPCAPASARNAEYASAFITSMSRWLENVTE